MRPIFVALISLGLNLILTTAPVSGQYWFTRTYYYDTNCTKPYLIDSIQSADPQCCGSSPCTSTPPTLGACRSAGNNGWSIVSCTTNPSTAQEYLKLGVSKAHVQKGIPKLPSDPYKFTFFAADVCLFWGFAGTAPDWSGTAVLKFTCSASRTSLMNSYGTTNFVLDGTGCTGDPIEYTGDPTSSWNWEFICDVPLVRSCLETSSCRYAALSTLTVITFEEPLLFNSSAPVPCRSRITIIINFPPNLVLLVVNQTSAALESVSIASNVAYITFLRNCSSSSNNSKRSIQAADEPVTVATSLSRSIANATLQLTAAAFSGSAPDEIASAVIGFDASSVSETVSEVELSVDMVVTAVEEPPVAAGIPTGDSGTPAATPQVASASPVVAPSSASPSVTTSPPVSSSTASPSMVSTPSIQTPTSTGRPNTVSVSDASLVRQAAVLCIVAATVLFVAT